MKRILVIHQNCEEVKDMNEKAEKKMIEKWLLIVDKPLMIGEDAEVKRRIRH